MLRPGLTRTAALLTGLALVALTVPPATASTPLDAAARQTSAPSATTAAWTPVPSYSVAAHDEPVTYRNGCHAWKAVVVPRACTFAHPKGARTVLLFGDSHAAHWHAAVLSSAGKHGWRMLTLTKSSCAAATVNVRVYKQTTPYTACNTWRTAAFRALAAHTWGKVDVIVVSDWHFHQVLSSPRGHLITGATRVAAWEAGMRRTLKALLAGAKQVVLLRDSPDLPGSATTARACYVRYGLAAQTRCGTTRTRATSSTIWAAERRAAASFPGRVISVDLTSATCPNNWCGPIERPYLKFKDDNHWTQTYMRAHFSAPVDALLVPAMQRAIAPL